MSEGSHGAHPDEIGPGFTISTPDQLVGVEALSVKRPIDALCADYVDQLQQLAGDGEELAIQTGLHLFFKSEIRRRPKGEFLTSLDWLDAGVVEIPLRVQFEGIERLRELCGNEGFRVVADPDMDNEYNLGTLRSLVHGNWGIEVGSYQEDHDREDHIDAFVLSPKEQTIAVVAGASYAYSARLAAIQRGESSGTYGFDSDIAIPAEYAGSKKGNVINNNLLYTIDNATGRDTEAQFSWQVADLLLPLLNDEPFEEAAARQLDWVKKVADDYVRGAVEHVPTSLSLTLACLEATALGARNRDLKMDEVQVGLYEVVKGYIRIASRLRGEPMPEIVNETWPLDESGQPVKTSMVSLVHTLVNGSTDLIASQADQTKTLHRKVTDELRDNNAFVYHFIDPDYIAGILNQDDMPQVDQRAYEVWWSGLESDVQDAIIEEKRLHWERKANQAEIHNRLTAAVPELYEARLPAHLEERLGGSRFAIGFGQWNHCFSASDANAMLQEHRGYDISNYDVGHRFEIFDQESVIGRSKVDTFHGVHGSEPNSNLTAAIERGHYMNEANGRFVAVFPDTNHIVGSDESIAQEMIHRAGHAMPRESFVNWQDSNGLERNSLSSRMIAGFIDGAGVFWENTNFMVSDEPHFRNYEYIKPLHNSDALN